MAIVNSNAVVSIFPEALTHLLPSATEATAGIVAVGKNLQIIDGKLTVKDVVTANDLEILSAKKLLVDLGSEEAVPIFSTDENMGIIGILPVSHGGTGATSASASRDVLNVYSKVQTTNAINTAITSVDTKLTQDIATNVTPLLIDTANLALQLNALSVLTDANYADSVQELANTRTYIDQLVINANKGLNNFKTEVELRAFTPTEVNYTGYALDTKKTLLWDGSKWNDTGLSEKDLAIQYVNENPLFNPIRLNSGAVHYDLNTVENTSYSYFSNFPILDVTANIPERSPFLFRSDRVHADGLTVPQQLITKSGNFYYRVCTRNVAEDTLVAPRFKKILDDENIKTYGFKQVSNASGVVDVVGRLTPDIITSLGLTSWKDITVNNTYNITSSTTATAWGLPEGRGGTLTFHKDGTTAITGRATYIPNTSKRIYTSTFNGTNWTDWVGTANTEDVALKQDASVLITVAVDMNTEVQTRRFRISSTSVAQAMLNAPFNVAGEYEIIRISEYTILQRATSRDGSHYTRTATRGNLTSDFNFPSTWQHYATTKEVEALIAQSSGTSDSIDKSVDNAVIGIGSSSMHRYNTQMQIEMTNRKRTYINAGFGGTGFASAAMFCGQGKYFMNFDNATLSAGVKTPFTWSGGDFGTITDMPTGDDYRDWTITLENGVRGKIYFGTRTFEPVAGTPDIAVNGAVEVYPNYARYKRAINVLNTGKNSFGDGSAQRIAFVKESFDETIKQLKTVQQDARFIVLAHHVNTGSNATITSAVQEVNTYLKNKYGNRFVDLNTWLTGSQIWIDLGITPTATDLAEQAAGHIPQSLTENLDKTHMNPTVANYAVVNFIIPKLENLGYI